VSVGDFRFAEPPSIQTVRIHRDAHGLKRVEWDCWECHILAPGTPILHRFRTPGVVFVLGSPAEFNGLGLGLGVTFLVLAAVNSSRIL
jgi:hypothetical protein